MESFEVYEGRKPYIFACYRNTDFNKVMPVITRLYEEGCRIWCDQGVALDSDFPKVLYEHLKKCYIFMVFISEDSVAAEYVRNETYAAHDINKIIIAVHLDDTEMPEEMSLLLFNSAHIEYNASDPARVLEQLRNPLAKCISKRRRFLINRRRKTAKKMKRKDNESWKAIIKDLTR